MTGIPGCRLCRGTFGPTFDAGQESPGRKNPMKRLHAVLHRIASWLDMVSGAYGATVAVRLHERPAPADLKRLGIRPRDFNVKL
jgi:hypothetical protein